MASTLHGAKISFHRVSSGPFEIQGILYRPAGEIKAWAFFTHGYTSSKHSIINWGERLMVMGVATFIFDLPGHLLGQSSAVKTFDDFITHAPQLFPHCWENFRHEVDQSLPLILGGHSLGALLAMNAAKNEVYSGQKKLIVGVGAWMNRDQEQHLFEDKFYQSTLALRAQYVSAALAPATVFSWLKKSKENLTTSGEKIYLLSGMDDLVAGLEGPENLRDLLKNSGNEVHLERPAKLAHHQPELAAPHLAAFLKKFLEGHEVF